MDRPAKTLQATEALEASENAALWPSQEMVFRSCRPQAWLVVEDDNVALRSAYSRADVSCFMRGLSVRD